MCLLQTTYGGTSSSPVWWILCLTYKHWALISYVWIYICHVILGSLCPAFAVSLLSLSLISWLFFFYIKLFSFWFYYFFLCMLYGIYHRALNFILFPVYLVLYLLYHIFSIFYKFEINKLYFSSGLCISVLLLL